MNTAAARITLATLGLSLTACGAHQVHRLPTPVTSARATFSPLAACAGARSMQVAEHDDSVNIKTDANTWVQYMIQNNAYNMVILVDDKAVPADQLNAKFTSAKATGDELFQCALGHASKNPPATPITAPAAKADMSAMAGDCAKLVRCNTALATAFCTADTDCQFKVEVKGSGDDAACLEALKQIPAVVEPMKMVKPDFVMPADCSM